MANRKVLKEVLEPWKRHRFNGINAANHLVSSFFFADSIEIMWPLITALNVSHKVESETSSLSFVTRNSSIRAVTQWKTDLEEEEEGWIASYILDGQNDAEI